MGRYNPLTDGDIAPAGELNGHAIWRLTYRADGPHPSMVEAELERVGYQPVRIGDKEYWVGPAAVESLNSCRHEICADALERLQRLKPEDAGDGSIDVYIPVVCRLCGAAGVFSVTLQPAEVDWAGK